MWEVPGMILFFYQNKPAALKKFFLGPLPNYHKAWINVGLDNMRAIAKTRSRLQWPWEMRRRLILQEMKQIYSLNVFYFLLSRCRYFLLVSFRFQIDLVHVLATTGNTSAVAGYTHV